MSCNLTETDFEPCQGMEIAMYENLWNEPTKLGFRVVELMHINTGQLRVAGVAYRYSRKKTENRSGSIYLNYCPFCGTPIHQNIQRKDFAE